MSNKQHAGLEMETARLAHAAAHKSYEINANMVSAFGNAAMRAPALAAAGGIAGILGFYSANADMLRGTPAIEDFNAALVWFFLSVLACVVAPGSAYFSQSCYLHATIEQSLDWARPFVHPTTKSKWFLRSGVVFHAISIVLVGSSIVALLFGGYRFWEVAEFVAAADTVKAGIAGP